MEAQVSKIRAGVEAQALAELALQALAIQAGVAIQALGRLAPHAMMLSRSQLWLVPWASMAAQNFDNSGRGGSLGFGKVGISSSGGSSGLGSVGILDNGGSSGL